MQPKCKMIAVVGRGLASSKYEDLFDILQDGVDGGKICYKKYELPIKGILEESDAYIFLATTPTKKDKPYIHLQANATEDDIISNMQELVSTLFKKEEDNGTVDPAPISNSLCDNSECDIIHDNQVLNGLIVEFDGKSFKLNKQDAKNLADILGICREYKFNVKSIVVD